MGQSQGLSSAITLEELTALNDEIAALVRVGVPLEDGLSRLGEDLPGRLGQLASRLADQLQLYCALGADSSAYTTPRLTGHLQTNADVIAQLTGVRCAFSEVGRNARVDIPGLGWQPAVR